MLDRAGLILLSPTLMLSWAIVGCPGKLYIYYRNILLITTVPRGTPTQAFRPWVTSPGYKVLSFSVEIAPTTLFQPSKSRRREV